MNQQEELTSEEEHRLAIRARLAVLANENRMWRRVEAMLNRVVDRHATTLAQRLVSGFKPRRILRLRHWVWWLRSTFLRIFYSNITMPVRDTRHQSSRTKLKYTDKSYDVSK